MAIFNRKVVQQKLIKVGITILATSFGVVMALAAFSRPASASVTLGAPTVFSGQAAIATGQAQANVTILLETPDQPITALNPVPESYSLTPVASGTTDSSGNFSISLPDSLALEEAAADNGGYANFIVLSTSGNETSEVSAPALIDPTSDHPDDVVANSVDVDGLAQATQTVISPASSVAPSSDSSAPAGCTGCGLCLVNDFGSKATDFEAVRVANESGVTEEIKQINNAQDNVSVGLSYSPNANFSVDGSVHIGNSITTQSPAYANPDSNEYARTHIYFAEYYQTVCQPVFTNVITQDAVSSVYLIQPTSAIGDTWLSSAQTPPAMPYKSCLNDPYGYAEVNKADIYGDPGSYEIDKSHSLSVTVGFSIFGFTSSIEAGYDHDVNLTYIDRNQSLNTLVCGNSDPNDSGTYYNSLP